jgi:hypothetical protein
MRACLAEAHDALAGTPGLPALEARRLIEGVRAVPGYAPVPAFEDLNRDYRALSEVLTSLIGCLHDLAPEHGELAGRLLDRVRAYVALRSQRDVAALYAMDGGLVGRGQGEG